MFTSKMNLDAAFGNVVIITHETYEITCFDIIINFDLHSDSAVVSFHLESNVVIEFDMHSFRFMCCNFTWRSAVVFGVCMSQYLFPVIFVLIIVTNKAIPSFLGWGHIEHFDYQ